MADLIKLKTGTIAKLEGKNANGTPTVALDKGSIYFAVDTTNHLGQIVYDAPVGTNGVDRIVMSTRAEYADEANIAQNVDGVVAINHGGTGATTATEARSNLELGNAKIFYGTCDTAAATTRKTVTCSEFTSEDLVKGAVIFVAFTNTNRGAASYLTLNVNNTGAKPIRKYYNYNITILSHSNELLANSVIPFVYTGTNWVALGLDANATYNPMPQSEANTGTATTERTITAKVLADTITNRIANALSDTNAMIYKGLIGAAADVPDIHEAGWVFKVSTAGSYVGENCEVGDLIICVVDGTSANNDDWIVVQKNIDKALYKSSNTFTDEHMLLADGTDGKVKSVAINPTLTLTAGTSEIGPKFKISVGGKTSSESTLGTANASTYGVTKLTNTVDATQESLAATPKLVSTAISNGINALDVSDTADNTKYVSAVSETNGKISVSRESFSPSITITSGDANSAPKVNVTVAGNSGTAQSLNTATASAYGVTKLSSASSSTEESVAATPKGVWTAINTLDGVITGTPAASKTLTAFSQTNGKVSATFGNIAIAASQVTSGTLPVERGGTGQTSVANIQAGKDGAGNTITTTYATKAEVNDLLAATDAMIFKTVIGAAADFPSPPYDAGWTYKIGAFGTYAGKICEVGDLLICIKDRTAGETGSDDDWMVVQTNLDNGLFKGTNVFADGQMLLADSTVGKVKAINIDPKVNMTAGTASEAPKFTITVGGQTSSSASIGTATTGVYGATKLSDATNSTSTSLAATANAVKKAYDLAASKTSNVGTITGVTAGAGLTGGGTSGTVSIAHSNSIDATSSEKLYKVKWDAQGHITGALEQQITDNSSNADVSNTDTNLITARTLYYQLAKKGYTTNTGTVRSVATGGGLTGGTITTTGTISHAVPEGAGAGTLNENGATREYIKTITTDAYGHITGFTTGTETVTNSHYSAKNIVTNSATGKTQTTTALTNGNVYLNLIENSTVRSSHKISGSALISVDSDSSGNLSVSHTVPTNASSGAKGSSGRTYLQTITTDAYGHVTGFTTASETVIDTHHQAKGITANASNGTTQTTSALTNGNVYYNIIENGSVRSSHKVSGSNVIGVTTDTNGNIAVGHTTPSGASATTYNSSGGTRTYVKTVTTDAYGHVTGVSTATETVTDTHHQAKLITTNANNSTTQTTTALTNGNVFLNIIENGSVRSAHKISSSAGLNVVTDASGNIDVKHTVPSGASATTYNSDGATRSYIKTITTDNYGHITGVTAGTESVTNTDTKVNVVARGTTKAYLLADTTAPTSTAAAHTAVAETGVYLDTTAGKLVATSFSGSGASLTSLNASNISSGTLAKERLATSGVTAGTYQGITVDAYGRVTGAVNQGYTTNTGTVTKVTAGTGLNTSADQADSATKGSITTTGTLYLTKSGVTAGSYGPSANATPAYNATFNVPYITVDTYGRVTAASTKTVKIPATDNTDTKQNITLATTSKAYVTGVTTAPTATAQALTGVGDTGVYLTTTAGELNATQYKINEAVTLQYNSTTKSLDFIFA